MKTNLYTDWILQRMRAGYLPICFLSLLLCSCDSGGTNEGKVPPTTGEYELTVDSNLFGSVKLSEKDVDTRWSPDLGTLYLGPSQDKGPVGTFILTLSDHYQTLRARDDQRFVIAGEVTMQDKIVGTGDELNGRTYEVLPFMPNQSSVSSLDIGAEYIKGDISLNLRRILFKPDDVPDVAYVTGSFTALAR